MIIYVITKWLNGARHIEGRAFDNVEDAIEYIKGEHTLGYDSVKLN